MQTKTIIIDGKEYNLIPKEVVYEEEYKVGDWITIIKGVSADSKELDGKTLKIKSIIDKSYYITVEGSDNGLHYKNPSIPTEFRKATPEEIKDAQKTIVKMYSSNKGEFEIEVIDGKAYYRPENKELPKEWIRDIINSFDKIIITRGKSENPYNVTISSLNVGCYHNCKKEDWENVYKLLN